MAASFSNMNNVSDLLRLIESNDPEWQEIKQLIYEQYHEVKDNMLVSMLYDLYSQSGSSRCLELLLNVREPHDKYLCDKMVDGLKSNVSKTKLTSLGILGFVLRKNPSWLYKTTQHPLMKELLKVLKHEEG